jgi:putative ABC transport system permease protein
VADFNVTRAALDNFRSNADNLLIMRIFNIGFATVIAVGVVYNIARISLAERIRELATLRVLGFTRGAVSYVLIGELAILTVCALPAGLLLGRLFAHSFVGAVSTETQRLPLVISAATYGWGALVVLSAAVVSALVVRREIARLSLMELLRARD